MCVYMLTGRGIFATKTISKHEYILEYCGKRLLVEPQGVPDTYLYEFYHDGKKYGMFFI